MDYESEIKEAIRLSYQIEIERKESIIQRWEKNKGETISIKLKFPNLTYLQTIVDIDTTFDEIRDYIDLHLINKKIDVEYNLVTNFPKKIYTKDFYSIKLVDEIKDNSIFFLVIFEEKD